MRVSRPIPAPATRGTDTGRPVRLLRLSDPDPDAGEPPPLWLPPSLRPPPPPSERPRIWVPETFGHRRTDEEQAYYRKLIQDSRREIDRRREAERALLDDPAALKGMVRREGDGEPFIEEDGQISVEPGPEVEPSIDARIIANAARAPVPHRKQIGPTCGLYALGMVMDFWHEKDPNNPTALVQPGDRENDGYKHLNFEPTTDRFLLEEAVAKGYTAKGEMYHGKYTAQIAADFGYQAGLHRNATLDELYRVLDAGHPAVVCYDNDANGNPGQSGGHKAHYAVIQGYFDHEGERYLVVKHSWRRTSDRVWRAQDFFDSWSQMNTTGFYGTPGDGKCGKYPELDEPPGLDLPPAGDGLASIRESLANVIIEVVPPGEPLVGGEVFAPQA